MPHQRQRRVRLEMEALEARDLPSASGVMAALPQADPAPAATQQNDTSQAGDCASQADQTSAGNTAGATGQTWMGDKGQIAAAPQWSSGGSDTKHSNSAEEAICDDSGWSSTGGSWKTPSADSMPAGSGKFTISPADSWYGYDSYGDSGFGYSSADWSGSSGYCDAAGDGYYYADSYGLDSSCSDWYGYDSYGSSYGSSYASSYDYWYGYDYSGGYDSWYYDSYASSYSNFGYADSAGSAWKSTGNAGDFSSNFTAATDKGNANATARSLNNGDAATQAAQALQAVKSSAELAPADLGQLLARQSTDPARAGQLLPTQLDSRHLPGSLSTPLTQAQDSLFDPFKHTIGQEVVAKGQSETAPQQAAVKPATPPASTEEQKPAHIPPQTFDLVNNALLANWDLPRIHAERIMDQVELLLTASEDGIPVSAWVLAAAAAATSAWAYAARQRGNLWGKLEWATPRSSWFTDGPDEVGTS